MEAEEIIKQLDMEQVEEIPMGTAISSPAQCALPYPIAMTPYHIHTERVGGDEEEEVVTHVDLPPLTGREIKPLKKQWAFICLFPSLCLSACPSLCLSGSLSVCPSVYLSVCPFICRFLFVCLSAHIVISVCLPIFCLSVCTSLFQLF